MSALGSYGSEVEHFLGKEEVEGSIPSMSSIIYRKKIVLYQNIKPINLNLNLNGGRNGKGKVFKNKATC